MKRSGFLDVDIISDPSLTIAWNADRYHPIRDTFRDIFLKNEGESQVEQAKK